MQHDATAVAESVHARIGFRAPTPFIAAALAKVSVYLCGAAVLAFLLLPSLLVVVMSFGAEKYLEFPPRSFSLRWYHAYLRDPDWIGPTLFSLRIAVLTAISSTTIGTMAALALVRGRLPGRTLINALVLAPMVAPGIIVAIALYLVFARAHLVGTTTGFLLAHMVLTVPYVVVTVSAALARFDPTLELAALSLGASRFEAIRRVTLPLALPGVLAGAAFAFVTSFDEAVVSFFISGVTAKTLPKKLFEDIDFDVSPTVAAVGTLLTLLSLLVMAVGERLRPGARRARLPMGTRS